MRSLPVLAQWAKEKGIIPRGLSEESQLWPSCKKSDYNGQGVAGETKRERYLQNTGGREECPQAESSSPVTSSCWPSWRWTWLWASRVWPSWVWMS